jgi:hypothetical protein
LLPDRTNVQASFGVDRRPRHSWFGAEAGASPAVVALLGWKQRELRTPSG